MDEVTAKRKDPFEKLSVDQKRLVGYIAQELPDGEICKRFGYEIQDLRMLLFAVNGKLGLRACDSYDEDRVELVNFVKKHRAHSATIAERTEPAGVSTREEGLAILERVRVAISNAVYEVVDISRIRAMPNQPRKHFNPERLLRLGESLKQVGQIMPGYLRAIPKDAEEHDRELIDGERRWRGALMAGVTTYRAMRVEVDDEAAGYIVSVIANFNREGHTVQEIATSIRVMHEQLKLGMREISESIGYHYNYVINLYGLCRLVPEVWVMLDPDREARKTLATTAAIEISRLPEQHQLAMAERVVNREVNLRGLREEVVTLSKKHGIPMRERTVDAHTQRLGLERKSNVVRRAAADLKSRFQTAPQPIIKDWTPANRTAARSELETAGKDIAACLKVIDSVAVSK